jgi:hypothetical protein
MQRAPRTFLAALLLAGAPAIGATWDYLARDEVICAEGETVCLRATLTYERNYRVLRLRGRVQEAAGPGLLTIMVTGRNRRGDTYYSPMEIRLRGKSTELVDFKMIPDYPEVYEWAIYRVTFRPDEEEDD